jgi:hypothetical protein
LAALRAFAAAQPGYVGPGPAATDGGRFAVFDSPASGGAAMTTLLGSPHYQALTVDQAANRWSNGGYGGEVGGAVGIAPDRPMSSLSDAERAQLATSMARREGFTGNLPAAPPPPPPAPAPPPPSPPAERGVAYAAAPPPGAKVMTTPAPAPVPTFDPAETVPHVVVPAGGGGGAIGYPPPAPTAPGTIRATPYPVIRAPVVPATAPAPGSIDVVAAGPPPMPPAGIYVDPSTKEPLKTISQTYQGGRTETYGAPDLGDYNTQVKARLAGIVDPRTASFDSLVNSLAQDRALHAQTEIDNATIARTKRAMTEGARLASRQLWK